MHTGETPFLHGLADDLGVEAAALRLDLVSGAGSRLSAPTTDAVAIWNDGAADLDFFSLTAQGGLTPSKLLTFKATLFGMVPMSNVEDSCGIDYAVSGQGADDDVVVKCTVLGVLPDNQPMVLLLSAGQGTIPLPLRTAEGDLTFQFTNTSGATIADVSLAATMKRVKSGVSEAGRVDLESRGIPVGKAHASLMGAVAEVAESAAMATAEAAPAMAKYEAAGRGREAKVGLKAKLQQVTRRALSSGIVERAEKGAAALFGGGSDDGPRFGAGKGRRRGRAQHLKGRSQPARKGGKQLATR